MAFSNTLQLTTVCSVSATPALTTVFRLSSNISTWQTTLPLEAPTFLWQVSASYTGGWQNLTTWTSQTTSFLLTATTYDANHNFRLLENRRNSTISLTSIGPSFSRSLTLTNLPSSENIELWLDATKGLFNGLSALSDDNSSVTLWADLSRKERNPIQTVINNLPTLKTNIQNGNNVLRFNGTSQFLEIPNSTATFKFMHDGTLHTVFIVARAGNSANPGTFYTFLGNNIGQPYVAGTFVYFEDRPSTANNNVNVFMGNGVNDTSGFVIWAPFRNNFYQPNQYNLVTFVLNPVSGIVSERLTTYVNITGGPYQDNPYTAVPSNVNASYNLNIGAGGAGLYGILGDLCEIIIYRGILTSSERSTVENYLKIKWGTP